MARLMKGEPPVVRPTEYVEPLDMFGNVDRAFERMFEMLPTIVPMRWPVRRWATDSLIPVDEYYQDGSLVIRAEIPGIDPDKDVELTVAGGMLHIQVERREEEKVEEEHYVRKEIHQGSVERTLPLPEGVTERDVKATYKDGMLEIVIPKAEVEPTKKIPVTKS